MIGVPLLDRQHGIGAVPGSGLVRLPGREKLIRLAVLPVESKAIRKNVMRIDQLAHGARRGLEQPGVKNVRYDCRVEAALDEQWPDIARGLFIEVAVDWEVQV